MELHGTEENGSLNDFLLVLILLPLFVSLLKCLYSDFYYPIYL